MPRTVPVTVKVADIPEVAALIAEARAERDTLRAALARHMNWFPRDGVRICAGCLADWDECPDRGLLEEGNQGG